MELLTNLVLIGIGTIIAVVCAGLIAEALRVAPKHPETLYWAPDIPIKYLEVDGTRLRYIKSGRGPALVLLHTLRTQLDIFEKLVPILDKSFTVYAFDYPGHGFSDIPEADYRPELFVKAAQGFLDKLDLGSGGPGRLRGRERVSQRVRAEQVQQRSHVDGRDRLGSVDRGGHGRGCGAPPGP